MKMSMMAAAFAAAAMMSPSAVSAQGLQGDEVSCQVTQNGTLFCDQGTATVGAGREFTIGTRNNGLFGINFTDDQLRINALDGGAIANLALNFRDLTSPFTSFSVLEISGFTGVTPSDITLNSAGRLRLDLGPVAFSQGDQIRLALSNVSAVPEPSTWAMLLFGFGAIGYSLRRARVRTPALA